jgi:hypothetical protein
MNIAETIPPEVDVEMARRFLQLVDANDTFTFQTFHDRQKGAEEDRTLAHVIPGPASKELFSLHDRGAGIYFTVNRTDGAGRKGKNITNIRAVWQEDDDGVAVNFPIEPSLVVESSPGRFHRYWLLAEPWPADERGRADHAAVMERMIETYGSDPNAKDLSRVLRVPGFLNRKHGDPHQVRIVSSTGWRYSRAEILAAFPPVEQIKAKTNGAAPHSDPGRDDGEDQRIRDALFSVDATERHVWLTIGMAIEAHYGQAGRALWDEWSLTAKDKHNPADQDRVWDSFKGSGISIGTLFHYAKHGGWEDSTKGLYEEWCRRQAPPKDGAAETLAFPATAFADVRLNGKERNYLIKGLLPRSGIVVVWGPPKSGKSFWCMDVFLHGALAWEYRERKVQQASVVYVALEGRNGIPARVEAFKIRHEVSEAPFYLVTHPMNLVVDADALIASIKMQGINPGAVCLDTLNRSLVGSESKDEDMSAYIAAAGKIEEAFGCLVVIVHHCGVDATRPRGHTSLTGAVEAQIAIKKSDDGLVTATLERAKDLEEGGEIFSRLELVEVGVDPDGDPITSLIVVPAEETLAEKTGKRLGGAPRRALDALFEALVDFGSVPPANSHIPRRTKTTTLARWEEICTAKTIASSDKADSKQKAFRRASQKLLTLGVIGIWKDQVWVCAHVGQH